jgi:3-oxoacid CoA-transferase subunit A
MTVEVVDAAEAIAGIASGSTVAIGGFGLCGTPDALVQALAEGDSDDLHVVVNNSGPRTSRVTELLKTGRVTRVTASYIGNNRDFLDRYLSGAITVELTPQGTLAERLRAGGAGIPAFYTPTGVGTQVGDGGIPTRYGADGQPAEYSLPKKHTEFRGRQYLLEHAIVADVALIRAETADAHGNLRFRSSARNFNPLCAMASTITIAEVQRLTDQPLDPDDVHLPGTFVDQLVPLHGLMHKSLEIHGITRPAITT